MDNKEAAMLAMEIALEKLNNHDYETAKGMALTAAQLFPQLDNIYHLLAVCEVHSAAQLMDNGLHDWYKIIQVESISDEMIIRNQYHRLALLLHPDKNKYPGAEAAFNLVSEANSTLSDRYKRTLYDVKRRHLVGSASKQQIAQLNPTRNFSSSNFTEAKQQTPQQHAQPQQQQRFTFWSACPSCRTRHQYYLNMLSRMVRCINCSKNFMAIGLPDLNPGNLSGVRKPDGEPVSKPSKSTRSRSRTVTGQRRGKRVNADTSKPTGDQSPDQNPNPGSSPTYSTDVNSKKRGRERTNGRARVIGTSRSYRRAGVKNPGANYNDTEADILSPSKKARVEVKGVQGGDGGMNAINTGTNDSIFVAREAREQDRNEAEEQVEPYGSARDNDATNTGTNASVSFEREAAGEGRDNGEKHNGEEQVEPNGLAGDNDVISTGTNVSTNVEREATEQDIDKGKEQAEPGGSAGDKDCGEGSQAGFTELLLLAQAATIDTNPDSLPRTSTGAPLLKEFQARFKGRNTRQGTECGDFNLSNGDASRVNNSNDQTQRCKSPWPNADASLYEYPDAEFHNFDMNRNRGQFQQDQIWALYSDLDTYPKFYGWVRKVESEPFKVHISWLKACPKSEIEKRWLKANLPISCGKFRITTQNVIYDKPDYFSHLVTYGRGKYCEILPRVGEIWAVYRNLSTAWTPNDLETCKYDIVQIKKHRKESMEVLPMKRVPNYRSVFMPDKVDESGSYRWEIRANQYILFSHRIPAVRLYGKRKGLWELDPASVPCTSFNRAN